MKVLATFLLREKLSLHIFAKHYPNCLLPELDPNIILSKSCYKSIFFSFSFSGKALRSYSSLIIRVRILISEEKFGLEKLPPISYLFSPNCIKGDFFPSRKSHALSTNCNLSKNSKPIFSCSFLSSSFTCSPIG
jgi:hypothetical protein